MDGACVVAPMHVTRLVQGYATVMCVVVLHDLEAGTMNAFARLHFGTASRMLDECIHLVAQTDATAFQIARRCVAENSDALFQFLNGGTPNGVRIGGGVHSASSVMVGKEM